MTELTGHFNPTHWKVLLRIAEGCRQHGGRAYLVGGCVRSALLGESVLDFDLEVFGLAPDRLEAVLQVQGKVTKVGKAFGIYKLSGWPIDIGLPRIERKCGEGHRDFTVSIDPEMPLSEAAQRRDFTMNAIYYDIMAGKIEDPLGGIDDLNRRILRHCSDRFPEDPLRVLRAMQLAARIPATVAPETIAICKGLNPNNLSPERFFGEWEKLLLSGILPSAGLSFLKDCGWIRFFPELEALIGCEQDPQWHPEGDVWTHTLHCLDAFARNRSGKREEDLSVGFAVLCHDMGKPLRSEYIDGKIRSHGHETAGLKPTRKFLEGLNVSNRITEQVLPLVKCHMRPGILFEQKSSPAAIRRLARDCGRMDLLLRVFQADSAGRPPMEDTSPQAVSWLREQAQLLDVERSMPKPLLNGNDLIKRGWKSGPEMGNFLDQAFEAQLDGIFTNREEAIQWLDDQGSG